MKLSDAILLGDSLKTPNSGLFLYQFGDGEIHGCAIGGALLADGCTIEEWKEAKRQALLGDMFDVVGRLPIKSRWPWLTREQLVRIGLMYSNTRCGGATIEQIADYVRSIEPQEEKETVNGSGEHQEVLADSLQR